MIIQGIQDPFVASLFPFYGLTYCAPFNSILMQNFNVNIFQYTKFSKDVHKYTQNWMKM